MQLTTTNKGFAPATLTEAIQFSEMLANSSMVPKAYQGKPQDILVCVQWGYEMGLPPMQALQAIAVINGKPSLWGDGLMALVQASSVCEDVSSVERSSSCCCKLAFSASQAESSRETLRSDSSPPASKDRMCSNRLAFSSAYSRRKTTMLPSALAIAEVSSVRTDSNCALVDAKRPSSADLAAVDSSTREFAVRSSASTR